MDKYYEVDRISSSDIKQISESIPHWLWWKKYAKSSKEMELGTAFHSNILEYDLFQKTYVVDDFNKRTNEGKEQIETLKKEGKILLSTDDFFTLSEMRKSYEATNYKFHLGIIEEPIYFDYLDVECKSKPDVVKPNLSLCIDFKTISDCSDSNIEYSIRKYKYYIQAEFYKIATGCKNFLFVFCEKKPPFGVRIIDLSNSYYEQARAEIDSALMKYKHFKETGEVELPYSSHLLVSN